MKYLKIEAFEKHVKEALPDHPSSIYTLFLADPFERKFVIEKLWKALERPEHTFVPFEELTEAIASPSLFVDKRCLVTDGIEAVSKKDFETLFQQLKPFPSDLTLILAGSSHKTFNPFYENMKKEMVLLDLTGEKPWDRKNRLHRWMLEFAREQGKQITPDAATYLLDFGTLDFSSLIQEVEKAATYVGEKKAIELSDVKTICHLDVIPKGWELSEALVWGGRIPFSTLHQIDASAFYGLVGQIRYHLKLGLFVATAIEKGEGDKAISKVYPKLRPKALEKYKSSARQYSSQYFQKGIEELFALEIQSRSGLNTNLVLDLFACKLMRGRRHALTPSS